MWRRDVRPACWRHVAIGATLAFALAGCAGEKDRPLAPVESTTTTTAVSSTEPVARPTAGIVVAGAMSAQEIFDAIGQWRGPVRLSIAAPEPDERIGPPPPEYWIDIAHDADNGTVTDVISIIRDSHIKWTIAVHRDSDSDPDDPRSWSGRQRLERISVGLSLGEAAALFDTWVGREGGEDDPLGALATAQGARLVLRPVMTVGGALDERTTVAVTSDGYRLSLDSCGDMRCDRRVVTLSVDDSSVVRHVAIRNFHYPAGNPTAIQRADDGLGDQDIDIAYSTDKVDAGVDAPRDPERWERISAMAVSLLERNAYDPSRIWNARDAISAIGAEIQHLLDVGGSVPGIERELTTATRFRDDIELVAGALQGSRERRTYTGQVAWAVGTESYESDRETIVVTLSAWGADGACHSAIFTRNAQEQWRSDPDTTRCP